jgi:predicted nucleotidyltransferase
MKTHLEYAIELAQEANNPLFKTIMLYGTVSQKRETEHSDIDIMLVEAKNQQTNYELLSKIFNMTRQMPVRFDLVFIEETTLEDKEQLKQKIINLESPAYYINAIQQGIVFDGKTFSTKAENQEFFQQTITRMKEVIHELGITNQAVYRMPQPTTN